MSMRTSFHVYRFLIVLVILLVVIFLGTELGMYVYSQQQINNAVITEEDIGELHNAILQEEVIIQNLEERFTDAQTIIDLNFPQEVNQFAQSTGLIVDEYTLLNEETGSLSISTLGTIDSVYNFLHKLHEYPYAVEVESMQISAKRNEQFLLSMQSSLVRLEYLGSSGYTNWVYPVTDQNELHTTFVGEMQVPIPEIEYVGLFSVEERLKCLLSIEGQIVSLGIGEVHNDFMLQAIEDDYILLIYKEQEVVLER